MFLSKMKLAASVVLVLALVGTGAGFLMSRAAAPARQQASAAPPPAGYPAADNRERVDIPALRDGLLVLVGTEIRPGEAVPEGDRVKVEVGFVAAEIVGDDNGPAKIGPEAWWRTLDPTGKKKYIRLTEGGPLPDSLFAVKEEREYRKLRLGDKIEKGQLLAIEDETVALNEVSQKIAKREAAEAEYHEAIKTKEEAIRRANQTEFTFSKGTGQISKDDYEAALLNRDRYIEEEKSKNAARKVAAEELWAALGLLKMHEIRSLDSGVVREILKRRGEAIHGLEPVVRLEVQDAADAPPDKQEAPPPAKPPVATVSVSSPVNGILTDVRVKVGDAVEEGQLLARLDDRLARLDVEQEKAKVVIAQASLQAAQKVLDAASVRDQNIGKLVVNHAVTEEEVRTAKLEVEKAKADVQIKEAGIAQAKAALEAAQLTLEMYEIHSPVRGVIRAIEKSRGEAVKNLDTVVQIEGKPKD